MVYCQSKTCVSCKLGGKIAYLLFKLIVNSYRFITLFLDTKNKTMRNFDVTNRKCNTHFLAKSKYKFKMINIALFANSSTIVHAYFKQPLCRFNIPTFTIITSILVFLIPRQEQESELTNAGVACVYY